MAKLIVVGAGETAEMAYQYFTGDSDYEVAAFAVERDYLKDDRLLDLPVVALEEIEAMYPPSEYRAFVAVAAGERNRLRARLCAMMRAKGYALASYVASSAILGPQVTLGDNCFIQELCVLQYGVRIGDGVTLWATTRVAHRSTIGDFSFLAMCAIAGFVTTGTHCFIGVNATVTDGVTIGDDCFINAGAIATKTLPNGSHLRAARSEIAGETPARNRAANLPKMPECLT